jgi:hypothetical protein
MREAEWERRVMIPGKKKKKKEKKKERPII